MMGRNSKDKVLLDILDNRASSICLANSTSKGDLPVNIK